MNAAASHDAVDLARDVLGGEAEWLAIDRVPAPEQAVSIADLVADGGAGVRRVVAHWRAHGPTVSATAVLEVVAWVLYASRLRAVQHRRLLIELDPTGVRLDPFGGPGEPTRVWWPADATVSEIDHADDAVVGAYRRLVDEAVGSLGPLLEVVRATLQEDGERRGRRGLWAHVVNTFFGVGPGCHVADPRPARAELDLAVRAVVDTPLGHRPVVVDIPRVDGRRQMVLTTACCLAYLHHVEPSDQGPETDEGPWDDGPWARYCLSCPLVPHADTVIRASRWIDVEAARASTTARTTDRAAVEPR